MKEATKTTEQGEKNVSTKAFVQNLYNTLV
jgi:hypothetical protein